MATYTYAQLEQLWIQAGGSAATAPIAAAVAEAESGGNPNATDYDSNGSVDRGLWQINSVHGSLSTFDPLANARAAVSISNGGSNWTAWVTFKNGAYKKFLQSGTPPATGGSPATGGDNASTTGFNPLNPLGINPLGDWIQEFFNLLKNFMDQLLKSTFNWILVALEIGVGGTLFIFGILLLIRASKTVQNINKSLEGAVTTAMMAA